MIALLLSLWTFAGADHPSVLRDIRWSRTGDTLHLAFGFAEGAYPRFRVRTDAPGTGKPRIHVEFLNASISGRAVDARPRWIERIPESDSGNLHLAVALASAGPWRSSWKGQSLEVSVLDRPESRVAWRNPWLVGGVGGGLAAGGIALWLLTGSQSPASKSAGSGAIPPPDIAFPK